MILQKMDTSQQIDQPPQQTNKTIQKERQYFALTQGQRFYIQHHLPKLFTLVAVSNTNSRLNCTSKALIQESLTFIDRKRGRPEGSVRKIPQKSMLGRKSKRIALTSKTKQVLSKDNQYSSFDYSNQSQREKQSNKNDQNYSFQSFKCAQEICFMEISLQEQMAKTCKQSQVDNQLPKNKEIIDNLSQEQLNCKLSINQNESKIQDLPPQQLTTVEKDSKEIKEIESKPIIQTSIKETISENIPQTKKQNQLKHKFQQQKTIIRRLKSHRQILPFLQPVDEIRDGAPNYYKQILNPIDLQTIEFKLKTGIYKVSEQFHTDVRLMWANAKSYNRKNSHMQQVTQTLQNYYLNILSKTSGAFTKKKGSKK